MTDNHRKDAAAAADRAPGERRQLLFEISALLLAGLSLFLLASLVSYRGTGAEGLPRPEGWTGVAGSHLSFALYQLVGLAAFALPAVGFLYAALLFVQRCDRHRVWRLTAALLLVVLCAASLHVALAGKLTFRGHLPGGAAGRAIGGALTPLFAAPGSLLLLGTLVAALAVAVSGVSLRACLRVAGRAARLSWRLFRGIVALLALASVKTWRFVFDRRGQGGEDAPEGGDEEPLVHAVLVEDGAPASDGEEPAEAAAADEGGAGDAAPPAPRKKKPRPERKGAHRAQGFRLPPFDLLAPPSSVESRIPKEQLQAIEKRLVETLQSFQITGAVRGIHQGPVVSTFEFCPESGTKLARIKSLQDDIAMSLEAQKVRIVAPIPGKNAVGFEVPNPRRQPVFLREIIEDPEFDRDRKKIPIAVGKDIVGRPCISDLDTMPHLLIAGTTGSGKSVCINSMLLSILYTFTPDELKLIMVDPKQVELQTYNGIPHLLLPVVTDPRKAALALKWGVDEMERRYHLLSGVGAKDIRSYNAKVRKLLEEGGDAPRAEGDGEGERPEPLPYVIIVIDELADLMMAAARDVEAAIIRLAQKARAAGIHLIVATQRPSVNVVTGLIKANFPCRIGFKVAAKIDSKVMLDTSGAEALLGNGDMLILPPGTSDLVRVQGAFVSEEEIARVADHLRAQRPAVYNEEIVSGRLEEDDLLDATDGDEDDQNYERAIRIFATEGKASVSYLQRQLKLGYNRSARIVERMEKEGIVGPKIPGKPYREVLHTRAPG